MPASVFAQTLANIDSGEPRALIAALSLTDDVKHNLEETRSSKFNPFSQESSNSPEDKEDNEGVTTTPVEEADLSPRSMLSRARGSPSRKCLILEELLARPEVKPTLPAGTDVCAVNKTASVRAPSPIGLQSAPFAQRAKVENPSKVLPPPSAIWKPQSSGPWLLPSTIIQNSIDRIGCDDSQADKFDDLAIFVGAGHRNILEDAWMNVIAAVAVTAEKQDLDSKLEVGRGGPDAMSILRCRSMDDPVVELGPRANREMKGAHWSKFTSAGGRTGANPFNPSSSAHSASPRWEALTIESL